MYGKCRDCLKVLTCHKPIGYRLGYCETDFEPKLKPPPQPALSAAGMQWKQISGTEWEARGQFGVFKIERRRGKFWSRYSAEDTAFNLPPHDMLSGAKSMCENNANWEDAV